MLRRRGPELDKSPAVRRAATARWTKLLRSGRSAFEVNLFVSAFKYLLKLRGYLVDVI
jgi:hypothetical protein